LVSGYKSWEQVELSYYSGPLCGFGCFLLFERPEGKWQELDRYGAWVS
jgi:hypothetical protein